MRQIRLIEKSFYDRIIVAARNNRFPETRSRRTNSFCHALFSQSVSTEYNKNIEKNFSSCVM